MPPLFAMISDVSICTHLCVENRCIVSKVTLDFGSLISFHVDAVTILILVNIKYIAHFHLQFKGTPRPAQSLCHGSIAYANTFLSLFKIN